MFFALVVFLDQFDDNSQRYDERSIHSWRYVNGIAVAEDRKLTPDAAQYVAVVIGDTEIPTPDITIDMEDHPVLTFDLKAFTKEPQLLMNACPVLPVAVDVIARQEGENALFDTYHFLTRVAIKHHQVIADVEKLPSYLEDGIACVISHNKCLGQA